MKLFFMEKFMNQDDSEMTELTLRGTLPVLNSYKKFLLERKTSDTCKLKLKEEISKIVSDLEKGHLIAISRPPVIKKRYRKHVEPSTLPVIQNAAEYTKYLNKVYYEVNLSTEKIIYSPDQTAKILTLSNLSTERDYLTNCRIDHTRTSKPKKRPNANIVPRQWSKLSQDSSLCELSASEVDSTIIYMLDSSKGKTKQPDIRDIGKLNQERYKKLDITLKAKLRNDLKTEYNSLVLRAEANGGVGFTLMGPERTEKVARLCDFIRETRDCADLNSKQKLQRLDAIHLFAKQVNFYNRTGLDLMTEPKSSDLMTESTSQNLGMGVGFGSLTNSQLTRIVYVVAVTNAPAANDLPILRPNPTFFIIGISSGIVFTVVWYIFLYVSKIITKMRKK
jgi:hypothetical protein